jgi:4-amino-4-deoxy-L-arabinose transferase-like glycosyltransferase
MGYKFFGQHDYIGRMIALAFGMGGLFALYQLIKLVWDKKHALAGCMMMAIIPGCAFIDRCFLPDPVMVALTTTCMWLFVLYLQSRKQKYLWLAALAGCLGILTKLPGLLIAIPMLYAFYTVYQKRGQFNWRYTLPVVLAGILVMAIVISYYLWAKYLSTHYPPYHFAGAGNWIWDDWKLYLQESFYLQSLRQEFDWQYGYPVMLFFGAGLLIKHQFKSVSNINIPWFFHFLLLGCLFYYVIGARELIKNPWNFHLFFPAIAAFSGRFLLFVYSFGSSPFWQKSTMLSFLIILTILFNKKLII